MERLSCLKYVKDKKKKFYNKNFYFVFHFYLLLNYTRNKN